MRQPDNTRIAAIFDRMAGRYDQQMGVVERLLFGDARQWAVSHARGDVVEIGVGTGLNLPRYGTQVQRVVGIDLSEGMLAVARRRAPHDGRLRVELRHGDVQALDLPDDSADTIVSTFTFCTIPDPLAASREAYRVLRTGGRFVLAEHGPSTHALGRVIMRAVEPLSLRIGADHLLRNPLGYLRDAGFTLELTDRGGLGGNAFRVLAHK